ncbi:hypothetical protein [Nocardioides mesophilus]|uniref:ABC transporter substrate-binding protein n=1 Tax=Nocardioides mesophilus TaxID=433659 RepID=A0A7G9RFR3_9ACTN|nr:hypothetical protein [Nocardioides mesophilus]QNN54438.1 hypothetical protein H9L09_09010 [Nocardioides mesophilus]
MTQARKSRRAFSAVSLVVGVVAMAMFTTTIGAAQAAPRATGTALTAASAQAPTNSTVLSSEFGKAKSRVVGSFGRNGTVTGSFTPKRFKVSDNGTLKAVGRLKATLVRGNGHVVGTTAKRVVVPVRTAEGTALRTASAAAAPNCDILNLVLGPLDLDLLGLQVHLDKVVLNIIAASGTGNLLGNLLCAVAGLLDAGGLLTQVSQILNSVLAILRL